MKTILKNIDCLISSYIYIYILKRFIFLNSLCSTFCGKLLHNNYGDDLNYFISRKLSEKPILFKLPYWGVKNIQQSNILVIGSIVDSHCDCNSIIWGAGAMYGTRNLEIRPKEVLAVRGPLTRQYLVQQNINCPMIYGDPALLLRYLIPKNQLCHMTKFRYGIIPHISDYELVLRKYREYPDIQIIDLKHYGSFKDIPRKICECEVIISSSLHGLIIADAYDIPNVWVEFSDNVNGNGFKFKDYFGGVHRSYIPPLNFRDSISFKDVDRFAKRWEPIRFNLIPLIESCPFISDRKKRKSYEILQTSNIRTLWLKNIVSP